MYMYMCILIIDVTPNCIFRQGAVPVEEMREKDTKFRGTG